MESRQCTKLGHIDGCRQEAKGHADYKFADDGQNGEGQSLGRCMSMQSEETGGVLRFEEFLVELLDNHKGEDGITKAKHNENGGTEASHACGTSSTSHLKTTEQDQWIIGQVCDDAR